MQETNNYKLNQWEKTDRIQMEDFNEDNARLEAALAAQETALAQEAAARAAADTNLQSSLNAELQAIRNILPISNLQTITTTSATNKLDIDLSGIDWNAYAYVLVRIDGTMSSSSASFYVRMNNHSGDYDYRYNNGGSNSSTYNYAGYCYLSNGTTKYVPHILISCQSDKPDITIHNHGNLSRYYSLLNRSETVSTLSLVGSTDSYSINSGAKIDIYGIKL